MQYHNVCEENLPKSTELFQKQLKTVFYLTDYKNKRWPIPKKILGSNRTEKIDESVLLSSSDGHLTWKKIEDSSHSVTFFIYLGNEKIFFIFLNVVGRKYLHFSSV